MVPKNAFLIVVSLWSAQPTWADQRDRKLLDCVAEALIMKRTTGELFEKDSDTYQNIADVSEALIFFFLMSNLPEGISSTPEQIEILKTEVANQFSNKVIGYDQLTSEQGIQAALSENEVQFTGCLIEFRDEIRSSASLIRGID